MVESLNQADPKITTVGLRFWPGKRANVYLVLMNLAAINSKMRLVWDLCSFDHFFPPNNFFWLNGKGQKQKQPKTIQIQPTEILASLL